MTGLKALLILLLPACVCGGLLAIGDRADGLKLMALSLLMVLPWMLLTRTATGESWGRLLLWLTAVWWLVFGAHSMILAAAWLFYESSIDAYFFIQAVAETTRTEALEFIQLQAYYLAAAVAALLLAVWIYMLLLKKSALRGWARAGKWQMAVCVLIMLLSVSAWALRPMRALSPPFYWQKYAEKVHQFQNQKHLHQEWQKNWLHHAQRHGDLTQVLPQQTVVLVLSESLTSFNFGVCGYPRDTTPKLQAKLHQVRVWCNAYSPYPLTIDAVRAMLTDVPAASPEYRPKQALQGYAKAAGFKTFWLSNQDDSHLSSLFGEFADERVYHNKRSGRSSVSKDEALLPYLDNALRDPASKKLIILHLIGAHPNYSARFPSEFARFPAEGAAEQQLTAELAARNIGIWVQRLRDDYDNSIFYQDFILNEIFRRVQQQSGVRTLFFLSDHGNEVGHEKDFAGHSPGTRAGYRIPIVAWDSRGIFPAGVDQHTEIDGAELDLNVLGAMGIQTDAGQEKPLWHSPNYRFQPPSSYPYWQQDRQ